MSRTLKFREDGTFVIVQFSDVELLDAHDYDPDTPAYDEATIALMERIIEAEQPDLIVYAGDVVASNRAKDPIESFGRAIGPAERAGIPWAAVFGNHDSEGEVKRLAMHEFQLQQPHCVAKPDPEGVAGAGNYVLTIQGEAERDEAALYFLDSGDYSKFGKRVGGYDWIHPSQIQWYQNMSRQLAEANGDEPLPALAFFHIPLPEYNELWNGHVCYGHQYDKWCSSPVVNSGMFAAMLKMGDVMGTFVGHDHGNDFTGTLHGIRLSYGRSTRYVSFVDGVRHDLVPTGARVIRLKQGERTFDTWIHENDGNRVYEQPEHQPEGKKVQL